MPPPSVLGVPGIVKLAVGLCKELAEEDEEAMGLCKSAQQLGDCDEAASAAARGLARAVHEAVSECVSKGTRLSKRQVGRAEKAAREAQAMLSAGGDASGAAAALALLADAQLGGGETSRALATAQKATELFRGLGDRDSEAKALATVLSARLAKATAGTDPRLELSQKKDKVLEAMRQQVTREVEQALEVGQEIVDIYQSSGDLEAEARALMRIAEVHLAGQEIDEAKMVAREVRSLYEDLEDVPGQVAAVRVVVAANLLSSDDHDQALMAAEDLVKIARGGQQGDRKTLGESLTQLARVQFQTSKVQAALDTTKEAVTVLNGAGTRTAVQLAEALQTQAQIHDHLKDTAAASKAALLAVEACRAAKDRAAEAGALQLAGNLELAAVFAEVEADPKSFGKAHNERLEEGWGPMNEALAICQELRNKRGEAEIAHQVQGYLDRAKKINQKVATPVQTKIYIDPVTKKMHEEHVYLSDAQASAAG